MVMNNSRSGMSRALVRRETTAGYLFLLPSLFFFLTFVVYPMVMCIITSFFDSNMGKNTQDVFIGFGNYVELFHDPIFIGALKNTFIIVLVSVPVVMIFSLWVANCIYDMKPWLTSLFRVVFYLPVVTGSVAVTVVWKWMFNNRLGIFNYLFKSMGIIEKNINWLGDSKYALACIILILLTTSVGQPIVLYVSALGNVDQSLVEAAEVDGANRREVFWKIKWPQIMPTTLYIL
ncbi:MAG: sugar ABC transporter permease, partial [Candidatus Onthomonas sp.]|nr:sugar ABC transporter permease [Candidatus Onthomonas sp.]